MISSFCFKQLRITADITPSAPSQVIPRVIHTPAHQWKVKAISFTPIKRESDLLFLYIIFAQVYVCVCATVCGMCSVCLYLVSRTVLVVRCLSCDYNMLECLQKVTLLALSTCLQRSRQGHVGRTWRHFCSLSLPSLPLLSL